MAVMSGDDLVAAIKSQGSRRERSTCWPEAPFDKDGNQLSYPEWRTEMRPVEPFEDTLEFVDFERGRSAARAILRRSSGVTVSMFLHDFEPVLKCMKYGKFTGKFEYCKRGENYGVRFAG